MRVARWTNTVRILVNPRARGECFADEHAKNILILYVPAMTLKMLSIIHQVIAKKQILTKRDIYYMDTTTFKTQGNVDRLVERLSRKFQVTPVELGIVSNFGSNCFLVSYSPESALMNRRYE
jgi:hypothetical protein